MISIFNVQEGDDTCTQLDDANIISDLFHQKVVKGHIYKDKNVLVLVMIEYAVRKSVNIGLINHVQKGSSAFLEVKTICLFPLLAYYVILNLYTLTLNPVLIVFLFSKKIKNVISKI